MIFQLYNIMTRSGFKNEGIWSDWTFAWFGMVILFFIVFVSRKQIGENMGVPFNTPFAIIGGFGAYVILITLTGAMKWALIAGIAGFIFGAFIVGQLLGSEVESSGEE